MDIGIWHLGCIQNICYCFYHPHTEYDEKVMFWVFLSIHRGGGRAGGATTAPAPPPQIFFGKISIFFFKKIIFGGTFLPPEVNLEVYQKFGDS